MSRACPGPRGLVMGFALLLTSLTPLSAQEPGAVLPPGDTLALDSLFEAVEAATVVIWRADGRVARYRPQRAARRFRPASTFKIPNSVIAIETGVATGPEHPIPWDSARVPRTGFFPESWARDQTLRSAFRNSVYWAYQELARRVGAGPMRAWLARLDYGNRSIAGGVDLFWLEGALRISPEEQVRFLRRLLEGELPVRPSTVEAVRGMARLEGDGAFTLFGKTGTSEVTPTRENGWIVGWLEGEDPAHRTYYAINMEGERVWEEWPPRRRHELALQVLRAAGALSPVGGPPRGFG